jgi:hypothetical protein
MLCQWARSNEAVIDAIYAEKRNLKLENRYGFTIVGCVAKIFVPAIGSR